MGSRKLLAWQIAAVLAASVLGRASVGSPRVIVARIFNPAACSQMTVERCREIVGWIAEGHSKLRYACPYALALQLGLVGPDAWYVP